MRHNNHFVPRSYLKRWANDEGKLSIYYRLVSHPEVPCWTKASVRSIACRRHLYAITTERGLSDEFECWIEREFETPAQEALRKATTDDRLAPRDWNMLADYLLLQSLRTPSRMLEVNEMYSKFSLEYLLYYAMRIVSENPDLIVEAAQHKNRCDDLFPCEVNIEQLAKDVAKVSARQLIGRRSWLFNIQQHLTEHRHLLHSHRWTIIKPHPSVRWITSDNPVCKLPGKHEPLRLKGGWTQNAAHIFFPLSPNHLLYSEVGRRTYDRGTVLDLTTTMRLQRFMARNSHRMIFSEQPNTWVSEHVPRIVNRQQFRYETDFWKSWGVKQQKLEEELLDFKQQSDPVSL